LLDESRVRECFWLFANTLPIGENQTKALIQTFGEDISKMLPELFEKLGRICRTYPEEFEGYLEFIQQSISYMRGESDKTPDVNTEDYEKMIQIMRIQLGEWKSKEA